MNLYGHWETPWEIDFNIPWVGFIYQITNLVNQKKYIGKKLFTSTSRKKVKGKINRKVTIKESNWKQYTSSSKQLNSDILTYGKSNFKFEILSLHESKSSLAMEETYQLVINDVLRNDLWMNGLIPPVKFKVLPMTSNELNYK